MPAVQTPESDYLRFRAVLRELPFHNGDRLDQPTFHRLYSKTPEGVKAELIGGLVYVASPTSYRHGHPHLRLASWIDQYSTATPGTIGYDNATNVLGPESEPEPDLCLTVDPRYGGQTRRRAGLLVGPPELVVEVAYSSVSIDLGKKKNDYEAAGVQEYVVALVEEQKLRWYERVDGRFVERFPINGILRSNTFPGLWLDPAGVFSPSGRKMTAALQKGLATNEHAAFVTRLEMQRKRHKPKSNGKRKGAK